VCQLSVASPQSGGTGVQYVFSQWEDGEQTAMRTVSAPSTTATYKATFKTQYQLTTNAGAGGMVSAGGFLDAGTTTMVTATPSAGFYFAGFSGTTTGSSNPLSVLMNGPQSITANFAAVGAQMITFTALANQTLGAAPFAISASVTSGLPITFTNESAASICSLSNATATTVTVTVVGAGTCTIQASQAGNTMFSAATPVSQSFLIMPGTPVISGLQAINLGGNSEMINWTTDQPATSQVFYGLTSTYSGSSALSPALVTQHSVTITGLTANTTYNYDVASTNSNTAPLTGNSGNATFATKPFVGYVAFWGVNNTGVTISWSTDTPANTVVAYGTTTALGQLSPVQTALSASHGAVLTTLNPGTTYYFQAQSTDAFGNTGGSTIYSFTTTGAATSPAPVISNLTVTNITASSAVISWTTDQLSTTQVNYGTTTGYGMSSPLASVPVINHSVTLTGLTASTTYNFDAVSANPSGTSTGTSPNSTFTTSVSLTNGPVITNVAATGATSSTVTITWTTDQPSWTQVNYGTTTAYGSSSPLDTSLVTSHTVTLTGLAPSTTYYFDVTSTNAGAAASTSSNNTFATTAQSSAPAPYVGYVAFWGVNNSGVTISWSTDLAADTEIAYGTSASSLPAPVVFSSSFTASHGVVLTGLSAGTTYYFQVVSETQAGGIGRSATYTFTTTGTAATPPVISNVMPVMITNNSATITWTTDQPSSSQVNYGPSTAYGQSSALDQTLVSNHSVTLTGLPAGTIYNFDVTSGSSSSGNFMFSTSGSVVSEPVISNVAATSVTSATAVITWTTDQPASSQVNFGTSTTYGQSSAMDTNLVTSHSVMLSGLNPSTLYNFDVVSGSTTSANATFMTTAGTGTPPVVSFVAFWGVTGTSVNISWSTDVPANTSLAYGTTTALGTTTPVQTALSTSHGVMLSNLTPGMTYYFVAQSADANGDTGYSMVYSFTTTAGAASISNVMVTPASNNTAVISWTTSTPTQSYVQYGPSAGNYNRYSAQTSLMTNPSVSLGYVPSGTVHYQLVSTDAAGNQTVSADGVFGEP
jgi:hypothetical protein